MTTPSTNNVPTRTSSQANTSSLDQSTAPQRRVSLFQRFGRRPNTSSNVNTASFAAASTSNLLSSPARGSSFSDLLRSSSSTQLPLSPHDDRHGANSETHAARPLRVPLQPRFTFPNIETTASKSSMSSTNTSSQAGSGSALGRIFRRYSQGGAARSDSQRPSTRDRDGINVSRNNSSSGLDTSAHISSPRRPTVASTATSPAVPRSGSQSASLAALPSLDTGSANPTSRNLAALTASPVATATTTSAPAGANSNTASTQADAGQQDSGAQASNDTIEGNSANAVATAQGGSSTPTGSRPLNDMHRIRLVPHLEATRSLHFEPIERDLKEGAGAVKVGRFTDRQPPQRDTVSSVLTTGGASTVDAASEFGSAIQTRGQPGARGGAIPIGGSHGGGGRIDSSRIAFKSKVVSRGHAEIWCEPGGKFFIRDTKSSSGTFLNHIRLSGPNTESRPFAIKDGDVVQLGVDYQGGTEEIYRCVKMRVELNRGWQREANQFNVNALRQLRALQGTPFSPSEDKGKGATALALPTNRQGVSVTDCCICLFSVTVCQALFIAPCSHVFHYKCIRPLLNLHHPGFSCPLCRTFADLDADVEEDEAWQEALMKEAAAAEVRLAAGKQPLEVGTPAVELDAPIISLAAAQPNGRINEDAASTAPSSAAARPFGAAVQVAHTNTNPSPARGTAALSKRRNDWARPDTAVGSSAGPLAGDETFAVGESPEAADLLNGVSHIEAEMGEMAVTDRLLNEDTSAPADTTLLAQRRIADENGSPARRGSGPIAIGGSHAQRSTPSTSHLAGLPALGNLSEGLPNINTAGGFSPGLDEAGTPLNNTLSTLAEVPQPSGALAAAGRDFPLGRSAPAHKQVPSSRTHVAEGEAGARRKRSSDGGEDVDTAEEEAGGPVTSGAFAGMSGAAKGKARSSSTGADENRDLGVGDGSVKLATSKTRGRSRSRSRSGKGDTLPSDSDDQEALPFQSQEHPPVPRTGPNLNASAYMSHQLYQGSTTSGGDRQVISGAYADNVVTPTSPGAGESKMARFKRRISHGM